MKFKLKIKAKTQWTDLMRRVAIDAIIFIVDEYGLQKVDITITVLLGGREGDTYGETFGFDDGSFLVKLRANKDLEDLIGTVFHEFTHVKQGVTDGLMMDYEGTTVRAKYKGVDYTLEDDNDYWRAPWEREARLAEVIYTKKYLEE